MGKDVKKGVVISDSFLEHPWDRQIRTRKESSKYLFFIFLSLFINY
jgi:hypothetical protein